MGIFWEEVKMKTISQNLIQIGPMTEKKPGDRWTRDEGRGGSANVTSLHCTFLKHKSYEKVSLLCWIFIFILCKWHFTDLSTHRSDGQLTLIDGFQRRIRVLCILHEGIYNLRLVFSNQYIRFFSTPHVPTFSNSFLLFTGSKPGFQ